uniref:Glycosyltransferase family 1 protein n=1 Tax=Leptospirillum ferriphilum TaxID=178606 RepID=A0A7C3LXQ2_9BACT
MNERPFKILYLMTDPFGMGGVQSDLKALGPYFVSRGHEVVVACPEGDQVDVLKRGGVTHLPFTVHFRTPAQFVEQASRLENLIATVNPTVLAPQSIRASWICHAAARKLPLARVTTIHNIHSNINALWAGVILNRASHLVIFESDHEHRRITRLGLSRRKARVIPSGIDTTAFYPDKEAREKMRAGTLGLKPEEVVFGCVARLSQEKAHRDLLAAYAIVRKSYPLTRLVLVGDGPLREETESLARSLGIDSFVHFAGQQNNVREWLNLFDVFVLASTRESLPRAAREAMACGLPVIATRVGATREAVSDGHNGFLVPPGHPDSLARAMIHLLYDPSLRSQMGTLSRQMIEERFSQALWLSGNEAVYRQAGALAGRFRPVDIGPKLLESAMLPCS